MIEPYDTFEHAGLTVQVFRDDDAQSPRDPGSRTLCTSLAAFDGAMTFGDDDEDWGRDFDPEIPCATCGMEGETDGEQCPDCEGEGMRTVTPGEYAAETHEAIAWQHVRIDDYGSRGVTLAAYPNDDADGVNCVIYVTREGWKTAQGADWTNSDADREMAARMIAGDIEELDQFLRGDVYGYVIEHEGEHKDSCWGFIGAPDADYLLDQARDAAEEVAKGIAREVAERFEMECRDIETRASAA
jgi:hypothetical protein